MADEAKRTRAVRVATYNIHRARGLDGRTRLERIAAVLASIDADIVALQEVVGASPLKPGQAAELGASLGMGWVMAPTRHLRTALFGGTVRPAMTSLMWPAPRTSYTTRSSSAHMR